MDPCLDICAQVTLHDGANQGGLDLDVSEGWGTQAARVLQGAADCPGDGDTELAYGAAGSVTFEIAGNDDFPCELDMDFTLAFNQDANWVPETVVYNASAVSVEGCN
jgi:hypothetical protein